MGRRLRVQCRPTGKPSTAKMLRHGYSFRPQRTLPVEVIVKLSGQLKAKIW